MDTRDETVAVDRVDLSSGATHFLLQVNISWSYLRTYRLDDSTFTLYAAPLFICIFCFTRGGPRRPQQRRHALSLAGEYVQIFL